MMPSPEVKQAPAPGAPEPRVSCCYTTSVLFSVTATEDGLSSPSMLPSFLSSGLITDVTCNQPCFVFELGV